MEVRWYIIPVYVYCTICSSNLVCGYDTEVALSSTIWLNCSELFMNHMTVTRITWKKAGEANNIFIQRPYINEMLSTIDANYTGRGIDGGWGRAGIRNAQMQDQNQYECVVLDPAVGPRQKMFNIIVASPPPLPTGSASPPGVIKGNTVTFQCSAPGVTGVPVYGWQKVGGSLPDGRYTLNESTGIMEIRNTAETDTGNYTCSVRNAAGEQTSPAVNLQVYYPPPSGPTLSGYTDGQTIDAGSPVTLQCYSSGGNPPANLTFSCSWSGFKDIHGSGSVSLPLILNRNHHEKTCTCRARHFAGRDSFEKITFNVLYGPGNVNLEATFPWLENGSFEASCQSEQGNPPNEYSWYKGGTNLMKNTAIVQLAVTKSDNKKDLNCTVANDFSRRKGLHFSQARTMDVQFSPRVTVSGNVAALVGTSTNLECMAEANPEATEDANYKWKKDGESWSQTGKKWNLGPLQKHQAGTYTCQVNVTSTVHGVLSGNDHLSVIAQYIELSFTNGNLTVTEEERLEIHCLAESVPALLGFHDWQHTRMGVTRPVKGTFVSSNHSKLEIPQVTYTDDGVYTCSAENEVVDGKGDAFVIVRYAPKRPEHPSNGLVIFTARNQEVTLSCNVTAVPIQVTFIWYHSQNETEYEVRTGERITIIRENLRSLLTINNVTVSDYGNYTVRASNGIRDGGNFSYILKANDRPGKPSILRKETTVTAVSVNLVWQANSDGGYIQTFSVYRKNPGEVKFELVRSELPDPGYGKLAQFKVEGLTSNTSYQFKVVAHNDHNDGSSVESDEEEFTTNALVQFDGSSMKVRYYHSYAELTWSKPQGHYDRQTVEQRPQETQLSKRQAPACSSDQTCEEHNVPKGITNLNVSITPGQEYNFQLVLYDKDDEVGRQGFTKEVIRKRNVPGGDATAIIIAFIGTLIAVLLIIALVIVFLRKRKTSSKANGCETGTNIEENEISPYSVTFSQNLKDYCSATENCPGSTEYESLSSNKKQTSNQLKDTDVYELLQNGKRIYENTELSQRMTESEYERLEGPKVYENTGVNFRRNEPDSSDAYEELKKK